MGDRGNIIIATGDMFPTPLYIYTHWRGSELPKILKGALKRGKDRWNDPAYLARVIAQDVFGGDKDITGFGLSTKYGDGGTDITVNIDKMTVSDGSKTVPFSEYIGE